MFAVYADRPEADDRPRGRRHHPARRAAAGILQARLPLQIPVGTLSGAQSVRVNVWDPSSASISRRRWRRHAVRRRSRRSPGPVRRSRVPPRPGIYIYRVTIDESAESRTFLIEE